MAGTRETARHTIVVLALAAAWPGAGMAAQSAAGCTGPTCAAPLPEVAAIAQLKQDFAASITRFAAGLSDAGRDRRGVRSDIDALERALAFNLSGHVLHSLFWRNLTPKGGGRPNGELADAITRDFGSFDGFQKQITEVAGTIMGSGWGALVYEPMAGRLLCSQIYDHQSNLAQAGVPLLVIDAWEHAYYLQYKTEKTKFFEAVWNLWNWDDVAQRYDAACRMNLLIPQTVEVAAKR